MPHSDRRGHRRGQKRTRADVIYVQDSDEEQLEEASWSDVTLRSRLIAALDPHLPLNPSAWTKINRWWAKGAPRLLLQALVLYMLLVPLEPDQWDVVEYFAGLAQLTQGFQFYGYRGYAYERENRQDVNNFTGAAGFVTAIGLAFQMDTRAAIASLACVCSSWIWASRSATGRSVAYPLGRDDRAGVSTGNWQVARAVMIMGFLLVRGLDWLLEQPMSSCLKTHPLFQWLLRKWAGKIFAFTFNMHLFGVPTEKQTTVYTTCEWIAELMQHAYSRRAPDGHHCLVTKVWNPLKGVSGGWDVTGIPHALKNSQTYPCGYGRGVASLFRQHGACSSLDEIHNVAVEPIVTLAEVLAWREHDDLWDGAGMSPVLQLLQDALRV